MKKTLLPTKSLIIPALSNGLTTSGLNCGSKLKPIAMSRPLLLIGFLLSISCDDHNQSTKSPSPTVVLAAAKCGRATADMAWMHDLMEQSKKDVTLSGNIYAFALDGQTIFVHQPAVISCMGCVLYNCDGTRIDVATIDIQVVVERMTPSNLIYDPY